jgi:hypothetical protein
MDTHVKPVHRTPGRGQDLLLDVTVPLVFAFLTAGFFALAAR